MKATHGRGGVGGGTAYISHIGMWRPKGYDHYAFSFGLKWGIDFA